MSKKIILDDDWKEDDDENEQPQEDSGDFETVVLATYFDAWTAETTATLLAQHKIPSFIANAPSSSVWGGNY